MPPVRRQGQAKLPGWLVWTPHVRLLTPALYSVGGRVTARRTPDSKSCVLSPLHLPCCRRAFLIPATEPLLPLCQNASFSPRTLESVVFLLSQMDFFSSLSYTHCASHHNETTASYTTTEEPQRPAFLNQKKEQT